jgi:hypothetical protein
MSYTTTTSRRANDPVQLSDSRRANNLQSDRDMMHCQFPSRHANNHMFLSFWLPCFFGPDPNYNIFVLVRKSVIGVSLSLFPDSQKLFLVTGLFFCYQVVFFGCRDFFGPDPNSRIFVLVRKSAIGVSLSLLPDSRMFFWLSVVSLVIRFFLLVRRSSGLPVFCSLPCLVFWLPGPVR